MNEEERKANIASLYDTFSKTIGKVQFRFKKELPVGKTWEVKNQFVEVKKMNLRLKEMKKLRKSDGKFPKEDEIIPLTKEEQLELEKMNMKAMCFILSVLSLDGYTTDEFLEMPQDVVMELMEQVKPYVFPKLKAKVEEAKTEAEKKKITIPTNPNPSTT